MTPAHVIAICYATILLEMWLLPVPSVASTAALLRDAPDEGTPARRGRGFVLLRFALPTAVSIAGFALPAVLALQPQWTRALLPIDGLQHPAVAWTGAATAVGGRAFTLLAVRALRRAQGALATGSVFAHSRNPALVGLHAVMLGSFLVFPCAVVGAAALIYALQMHDRVRVEEAFLRDRFADRYEDYCRRVPRYLL